MIHPDPAPLDPARGAARRFRRTQGSGLPGLVPSLGFTWLYLSVVVLLPLSYLVVRASGAPAERWSQVFTDPRILAALRLSFGAAFIAAATNVVLGTLLAWVLGRYRFPGRGVIDALVELPFALPTSVAGITLTFLYAPTGWFGRAFEAAGIKVAFAPLGIVIALVFVGLPFVVRTVEPVVRSMDPEIEEAALSLGASPRQAFFRVTLPAMLPSMTAGFALALARALGEYGSVLFISGNLPMKTEIAPLLIVGRLEQYDYDGAALLAAVLLFASVLMLFCVQLVERWASTRFAAGGKAV